MMAKDPKIIDFEKVGNDEEGYLSISNNELNRGFEVKRVFWTYKTPKELSRGRHAHHRTEMILIAVNGEINVTTQNVEGQKASFTLNDPNKGLYLPRLCWHEMRYSENAVQLVLCSTEYDEKDYIRTKDRFDQLIKKTSNE